MLTISKPMSAGQASAYHAEEFTNATENYYTEGTQSAATGTASSRRSGVSPEKSRKKPLIV